MKRRYVTSKGCSRSKVHEKDEDVVKKSYYRNNEVKTSCTYIEGFGWRCTKFDKLGRVKEHFKSSANPPEGYCRT
jgi:hypothetical protein